jgi:type IV secretion system protein VirB9
VKVNGVRNDYTIRIGDEFVCIRRVTGGTTTASATVEALRAREF